MEQVVAEQPSTRRFASYSNHDEGKWKDGLFDCCSQCSPSCCMATWCPCVILGQMYQKTRQGKCRNIAGGFILGMLVYAVLVEFLPDAATSICSIFTMWLFILTCALRSVIRKQKDIDGSDMDDCCVSFWCTCCAIAQMARQTYNYTKRCHCPHLTPDGSYNRLNYALDLRPRSDIIQEV